MKEANQEHKGRLVYKEHDLIPIPEGIPALGLKKGNEGLIQTLSLRNDEVVALVKISYSTGQTRGWIEMNITPAEKILSYSSAN